MIGGKKEAKGCQWQVNEAKSDRLYLWREILAQKIGKTTKKNLLIVRHKFIIM